MLVLNLLNRIFGNKGDLSRSEIDNYVKEKRELQKIEEKSLGDHFNSDALEGFEKHSLSTDSMKSLDEKMSFNKPQSKVLYIALFSAAAILVITLSFYGINKLQNINTTEQLAQLDKDDSNPLDERAKSKEAKEADEVVEAEEFNSEPNKTYREDRKSNETNSQKDNHTPVNSEALIIQDESEAGLGSANGFNNDELPPISSENLRSRKQSEPTEFYGASDLTYKSAKEVYFHDFKLIDYREYRSGDKMKRSQELPGVPADKNSFNDQEEVDSYTESDLSYILYIEETMRLLKNEKIDIAMNRFHKILEFYPDDVNANFYLGFAYYQNDMFNEAIPYFENSYTFFYGNFYEEAQFLIAKSLLGIGDIQKAKKILNKIISGNGFYKEQSQELLKGM